MRPFRYIAAFALTLVARPASAADFDIVVYGGTGSGVAAAVQGARMGKSVVVIEPSRHVGGLTSGGLGYTDSGNKAVIGGVAREFYRRVKNHYDDPKAWVHQRREQYANYRPKDDAIPCRAWITDGCGGTGVGGTRGPARDA